MDRRTPAKLLAALCRAALDTIWVPQCPICGTPVDAVGDLCPEERLPPGGVLAHGPGVKPRDRPPADGPLVYGVELRGPIRQLVHNFKYGGLASAREALAEAIVKVLQSPRAQRVLRVDIPPDAVIVPVPTHPVRVRERGWDHTRELSASVGRRLGIEVVPALRRGKWTPSLTKLGEGERRRAVEGAMALRRRADKARGRFVILLDDVLTTGVTLSTCVEALRPLEPQRIIAAVGARTLRHSLPWS